MQSWIIPFALCLLLTVVICYLYISNDLQQNPLRGKSAFLGKTTPGICPRGWSVITGDNGNPYACAIAKNSDELKQSSTEELRGESSVELSERMVYSTDSLDLSDGGNFDRVDSGKYYYFEVGREEDNLCRNVKLAQKFDLTWQGVSNNPSCMTRPQTIKARI